MVQIIKLRFLIFPVFIVLMVSGCLSHDWEEKEKHEKEIMQNYLNQNNITDDQKTEGGIYFIEQVTGSGLQPHVDDYVVINFTGRYLEGLSIHETSIDSLKGDWDNASSYQDFVYGPLKIQFGYSIAGINEGLSLMKEGGKARLVIPSDKAFYDFNPLVYDVELLKVIRNPIQYEDSVLSVYLADKGFDSTTWYRVGQDTIYYRETAGLDTTGLATVQTGDTVTFRYTGRLVDGFYPVIRDDRVFESRMDPKEPIRYLYNSKIISGSIPNFPPGLKEALSLLREGSHATIILPYTEAFDKNGYFNSKYGYTIVPKYQTVVYDVIVDFIHGPVK